jgi:hypothetical protein
MLKYYLSDAKAYLINQHSYMLKPSLAHAKQGLIMQVSLSLSKKKLTLPNMYTQQEAFGCVLTTLSGRG